MYGIREDDGRPAEVIGVTIADPDKVHKSLVSKTYFETALGRVSLGFS